MTQPITLAKECVIFTSERTCSYFRFCNRWVREKICKSHWVAVLLEPDCIVLLVEPGAEVLVEPGFAASSGRLHCWRMHTSIHA